MSPDRVLMAWKPSDERALRISVTDHAGSAVLRPVPIAIPQLENYFFVDVEWDGANFLVSAAGTGQWYSFRVAPDGTVLDEPFAVSPTMRTITAPIIATHGTIGMMDWPARLPNGSIRLMAKPARELDSVATRGTGGAMVTFDVWAERAPRIAQTRGNTLAVWLAADDRGVIAALNGWPVRITRGDEWVYDVAVAASKRMFVVAWIESGRVLAMRIGADGSRIDREPVLIANQYASEVEVTERTGEFLIRWSDRSAVMTESGLVYDGLPWETPAPPIAFFLEHSTLFGRDANGTFVVDTCVSAFEPSSIVLEAGSVMVAYSRWDPAAQSVRALGRTIRR